jgi:hypothetical protein
MFYLISYRGNNTLRSSNLQGYDCQKLPIWLRTNMLPKLLNKNKVESVLIGVAIALVTMSSVPSSIGIDNDTVC